MEAVIYPFGEEYNNMTIFLENNLNRLYCVVVVIVISVFII